MREGATVVLTDVLDLVHKTTKSISGDGYKAVSLKMDITKAALDTKVCFPNVFFSLQLFGGTPHG